MNPTHFQNPAAGKVIKTATGYYAFIPASLPPKFEWEGDLVLELSKADAALSELAGIGRLLPNPHLLIAPLLRREAVLSSKIEGTRTTLSELLLDEADVESSPEKKSDLREVRNYVRALEYGISRLKKLPLSCRLVRELHEKLLKGVRGDTATPGEFRRTQNWIGSPGSTLQNAVYVPPPPDQLLQLLSDWENFLHQKNTLPDLVQCALMHEHFEAIHPFLDGNGRVGRLLITLFLIERERLSQPLLYLSDFIEKNKGDYYDLLQRVRTHGEWQPWILYFLRGVSVTAKDASKRASSLIDLQKEYRKKLGKKTMALRLMEQLFINPYITVTKAVSLLKTTHPTATKAIENLVKEGILKEVSGRQWKRVYLANEILKIVEKNN